jgi:hypothetical protein
MPTKKLKLLQLILFTISTNLICSEYISGNEFVSLKQSNLELKSNQAVRIGKFDKIGLSLTGNFNFSEVADKVRRTFKRIGKCERTKRHNL